MVDVTEVVRDTNVGRSLVQQGRDQGEHETLVRVLTARFPAADRAQVERTATRLQSRFGPDAASAVLAIEGLGDPT